MSELATARITRFVAVAIAAFAAIGAVLVDGDVEVVFLMVAAVISGLVCFDTAMERRLQSFGPWAFLSVAPALKTVPTVWFELRPESGLQFERYDLVGSLLFGLSIFAAVLLLARPAERLARSTVRFDAAVVIGSAVTGAVAGGSVGFLVDNGAGLVASGQLIETPTWFVLSGILAASAIAAGHVRSLSFGLVGVLSIACVTAGLLTLTVSGREIDAGWWASLFAATAVVAVVVDGALGERIERDRHSNVAVVVALAVGLVAAASAVWAWNDGTAWASGWVLLGMTSLAMFALVMVNEPLDNQALKLLGLRGNDVDPVEPVLRVEPVLPGEPMLQPDQFFDELRSVVVPSSPDLVVPQAPQVHQAPQAPQVPLSDPGLVASAQAAAAVRNAPQSERYALAPLAQAHYFDPSTGLLSAAGLQHVIAQTFEVPRHAGHVTMFMFMIRDLDRIEQEHGRLASNMVTREVADRVGCLLPEGAGARFSRAAYAVVIVGDRSNVAETTQWLTRVLLQLRCPVEGGSLGDKIDVVAGVAQCYESEDAAQFVKRANLGFARAVQRPEPTLVAMA